MQKTIAIGRDLCAALPSLRLGIVTARITNSEHNPELWGIVLDKMAQIKASGEPKYAEEASFCSVKAAFKALGCKNKDYAGSNVSLYKRASKAGFRPINTAVDLNNLVSLEAKRSVGLYDLDALGPYIAFRKGEEGETYGGTTKKPIDLNGLTVLVDQGGSFGSPYSDSDRALTQLETRHVMMVIFSFDGEEGLREQLQFAETHLRRYLRAELVSTTILSPDVREVELTTG